MSKNIFQVYTTNPITSNDPGDLMYFGRSPYSAGDDTAMTFSDFAAQFGNPFTPSALTATPDTNVTISLGGTPASALLQAVSITLGWTGILSPARGGTGVNNGTSTLTLGGNLSTVGAFTSVFTMTGNTAVTFPTSGTLATTSQIPVVNPAALTEVNDTNVTMTLGGTPSTALLQAVSMTLGWTGQLSPARGGTGVNNGASTLTLGGSLTTSGAFASTFTMTGITSVTFPTSGTLATVGGTVASATGTANQVLINGTSGSAQTGALTFTLPQSIATTSNVQFGNVSWASQSAQSNGAVIKSADGFSCLGIYNGGGTSVNYIGVVGGATGVQPQLYMGGSSDTDVGLQVTCKAAGVFTLASTSSSPFRVLSGTGSQHTTLHTYPNTAASRTYTWPDASGTVALTAGSGGLKSFTVLTSGTAATYTTPAGITSILVEVVGAGGGGGGSTGGASTVSQGGGGGAGGFARLWIPTAAASYTYTIGAAGTGATAGANAGGTGGTTTFSASSLQATGGIGGSGMGAISVATASAVIGGDGGVGSNGNINVKGMPGLWSVVVVGVISGASGGSSHYGGGGYNSLTPGVGGAGGNYGSGGSGGYSSTVSAGGGAGSAGLIIVWEFA